MDLSKLNLNLLVALDALLKEQHVTRAGQRLHISQSAMSSILRQLREVFSDELFIRGQASRIIPTPRALELAPLVATALEQAKLVFNHIDIFDPQTSKHTFTLGMSDYTEFLWLPPLIKLINQTAPQIKIVVKHINAIPSEELFEKDEIDVAIGMYNQIPERLIAETLYTDKPVCVGCKHNPLLQKKVSLEAFANAPHLLILYFENRDELLSEQYLKKLGLTRNVVATVPHALVGMHTLINTPLITLLLKRMAEKIMTYLPLTIQPSPIPYDEIPIKSVWHPKNRHTKSHQWLRQQIRNLITLLK